MKTDHRSFLIFAVVSLGVVGGASLLDRPVWQATLEVGPAMCFAEWCQALRSLGYLPVWFVVAVAFFLIDLRGGPSASPPAQRALQLSVSVLAAGGLSEVIKLLIRRPRPDATGGEYAWRPFLEDPFSTSGLGMPSGHAMVAFAAAWVLCRLFPAAAGLWIAAACGCAATRIVCHAHFLSDTVLAAVIAFALVHFVWVLTPSISRGNESERPEVLIR